MHFPRWHGTVYCRDDVCISCFSRKQQADRLTRDTDFVQVTSPWPRWWYMADTMSWNIIYSGGFPLLVYYQSMHFKPELYWLILMNILMFLKSLLNISHSSNICRYLKLLNSISVCISPIPIPWQNSPGISHQWIGLRENLQETPMIFMGKSMVSCRFSL